MDEIQLFYDLLLRYFLQWTSMNHIWPCAEVHACFRPHFGKEILNKDAANDQRCSWHHFLCGWPQSHRTLLSQSVIDSGLTGSHYLVTCSTLPPPSQFFCLSVRQLVLLLQSKQGARWRATPGRREGGHWQYAYRQQSICSLLELTLNAADTLASHGWGVEWIPGGGGAEGKSMVGGW